jgi:hypothetical protein
MVFLTAAIVISLGFPLQASISVGDAYNMHHHPLSAPQQYEGPFEMNRTNPGDTPPPVTPNRDPANMTDQYFWTFCVEQSEFFTPGNTYYVGGTGLFSYHSSKQLSGYSAWIYSMFRNIDKNDGTNTKWGLPTQITSGGIDGAEYNVLQYAIWLGIVATGDVIGSADVGGSGAEQQIGKKNGYLNINDNVLTWSVLNTNYGIGIEDFIASGWGGSNPYNDRGQVVVLNMYSAKDSYNNQHLAQDQLGIVPPETQHLVPEPVSFVIWILLGAVGLAVGFRRQKKSQ